MKNQIICLLYLDPIVAQISAAVLAGMVLKLMFKVLTSWKMSPPPRPEPVTISCKSSAFAAGHCGTGGVNLRFFRICSTIVGSSVALTDSGLLPLMFMLIMGWYGIIWGCPLLVDAWVH